MSPKILLENKESSAKSFCSVNSDPSIVIDLEENISCDVTILELSNK
jgi:hypothetical protein